MIVVATCHGGLGVNSSCNSAPLLKRLMLRFFCPTKIIKTRHRNEYLKSVGIPRFTTSNKVLLSQIERLGRLQLLIPLMSIGMCGGLNIQMLRTAKTSQVAISQVSKSSDVD